MIRTEKRVTLCAVLLVLNVAFIWINSLLPREVSAAFSKLVGKFLSLFISGPVTPAEGEGQGILRKVAHFTEFCTLGVLLNWMAHMLWQKKRKHILLPLAVGVAVACVDETIQCFIPGRGPGVLDVLIDSAGVLLGVSIISLIVWRKNTNR